MKFQLLLLQEKQFSEINLSIKLLALTLVPSARWSNVTEIWFPVYAIKVKAHVRENAAYKNGIIINLRKYSRIYLCMLCDNVKNLFLLTCRTASFIVDIRLWG